MKIWKTLLQPTMLINLVLGFSSGIPLLLTSRTLQAWLTDAHVGLSVVGLFSLVGLPYTLKFLWAPVFDRFVPPFLGRRRGWLLIIQAALAAAILLLAVTPPNGAEPLSARLPGGAVSFLAWLNPALPASQLSLTLLLVCFLVASLSASQDIVVDAFRRESLRNEELGMGSTVYVYGYRLAMWITGGLAFMVADLVSWPVVYGVAALLVALSTIATLVAKEPATEAAPPRTFRESVVQPLAEFFSRQGVLTALTVLLFILLYKAGDTMAGNVAVPFYKHLGFTNTEIGAIAKTFGLFAVFVGSFLGGAAVLKFGIYRALFLGGVLQALSTAGLAILEWGGPSRLALIWVIGFEDVTQAMGTAAFVAFMAAQTNKRFTAFQYAILTSLMGVPRTFIAAPAGILAEDLGYARFFLACTVAALPGLLLVLWMHRSPRFRLEETSHA